jgi:hypothetical protein
MSACRHPELSAASPRPRACHHSRLARRPPGPARAETSIGSHVQSISCRADRRPPMRLRSECLQRVRFASEPPRRPSGGNMKRAPTAAAGTSLPPTTPRAVAPCALPLESAASLAPWSCRARSRATLELVRSPGCRVVPHIDGRWPRGSFPDGAAGFGPARPRAHGARSARPAGAGRRVCAAFARRRRRWGPNGPRRQRDGAGCERR